MPYEELKSCLEQKEILLTRIMNLARQIEVQCTFPDPELLDLLQQRQVYIDRLKKCSELLIVLTKQLDSRESERIGRVLSAQVEKETCSAEELRLMERESKCRTLLRETAAMDSESAKRIGDERDRMKSLISRSRKSKDGPLFSHFTG